MDQVGTLLEDLASELQATEELPVERTASRWIGEAEAVATDLTHGDPDADTVARRVDHVADLLDNVEETGHPEADERVATAKSLASELVGTVE